MPRVREDGPHKALALAALVLGPAALILAWLELERPFVVAFAAVLAVDLALDNLRSPAAALAWLGTARATFELATRAAIPLALDRLRPYLLETESVTFWSIVGALAVPAAFAFIKYGRLPRYRTRAGAIAFYLAAGATLFLIATGATWPLRVAAIALVVAAVEESAITAALPAPRAPVRSLSAALRLRRE
jgi:hypothetical protein